MQNEHDWLDFLKKLGIDQNASVHCGIGDDAALLKTEPNTLAMASDFLIDGVHVDTTATAQQIAYKALARNVSDISAMGAKPKFYMANLALGSADLKFSQAIYKGFKAFNKRYGLCCVGGDTSSIGKLAPRFLLSISLFGYQHMYAKHWRRSDAKVGDDLYLTGCLGDAGLALHLSQHQTLSEKQHYRLYHPPVYIELVEQLAPFIQGCIDVSDGFIKDLSTLICSSNVGAVIDFSALPSSPFVKNYMNNPTYWPMILNGGDDYELLLTAPPSRREAIELIAKKMGQPITRIGKINTHVGQISWPDSPMSMLIKQHYPSILQYGYESF